MAYNKVEANGETLIDLTSDTVTADTLVSGRTAHLASGAPVVGTFVPVTGVKGNAESAYRIGNVNLTPANLGLGNVDNTSDADKPISTAIQAALDSQQEQINYNTNNGVKNLLITDSKSGTVTSYGVTVTSNNDGTFTINGTNSNSGYTLIAINLSDLSMSGGTGGINQITPKTIKSNKVIFYAIGLPSNLNFQLAKSTAVSTDGVSVNSVSGSAVSNVIDITNYGYVWFRLVAQPNASYNNVVIKPMVVDASVTDTSDFVPYAKSNAELTQDLDDISGELDCLLIQAALVNNEVIIQNTSDFTSELYSKYFSYTKPKFAILKLQITSNTHYYKALINSLSVSQGNLMEASFMTLANGEYIYNFTWLSSGTVGTPTVTRKALNLGS